MKTKITVSLLIVFMMGLAYYPAYSQESTSSKKEQRKLEKEQKKKEKEMQAAEAKEVLAKLLENKCFVFKASRLQGPQGASYSVPPDRNFLGIQDSLVIFQFAFDNVVGWNGVGGATMEGFLNNYTFKKGEKNKPMIVESRIAPKIGSGSPYFMLTVMDSGDANLELRLGDGTRLKLNGIVTNPVESGINIGRTY